MEKSYSASYAAAGVDITAGYKAVDLMKQHVARTMNEHCIGGLGGFGGLFELDCTDMPHPVLISGTDGVGTKLRIAQYMNKHDTVGIDCVAMCVNDVICAGAKPLVFLDYIACGKNVPERIAELVAGVAEGCVQAGCALVGGETAEMPGFYPEDEYDLAGFTVGAVDKSKILGFVTAGGSGSSHTAILARTMGIPAIVGVGDALKPEYEGRSCIIDGATGNVVIDPDDMTRDYLLKKREQQLRLQRLLETLKGQPNVTKDGKSIRIYCNIGSPDDVHAVQVNDGGGIGLFRSEFLYLNSPDYPTEDQQFEAYKKVLADMGGKEVIIRTLDIGADKQIGYFNLPKEDNPAMGMRALRICLNRPEIFKTQLRALYRASAFGKLGIMFPMVTSVWEVREAKKYCEEVKRDLKAEGIPFAEDVQVGIMIETPAAAIMSDRLAKEVDFFSCGTNDLTQYTLACDRQNNDLGRFYDPHNPAVLRLLKMVTENAHKNGIWVGICGELGADLTLTETFLAIGVDELSVSPRAVLPLRNAVRMTDTRESAPRLLAAIDAEYPETL